LFHEAGFANKLIDVSDSVGATSGASFTGTYGDFRISLAFGDSNFPGGLTALNEVSNARITNIAGGSKTLSISVSAQDFGSPLAPPALTLTDTVSGSVTAGTVMGTARGFADTGNHLFGTTTPSGLLTVPLTSTGHSFSEDGSVSGFSPTAPYSLTFVQTLTLSGGATLTLNGGNVQDFAPTPEPAAYLSMGIGLLGLLYVVYRRRRLVPA
jgi:hypothetical protein